MRVCIVVLNWNGEKYISKCLKSLAKLSLDNHTVEIVVVDNGSTDESVSLIKKDFPKYTLIETKQNLGYAGGNNIGLRYALEHDFDWVWIVNPDIEMDTKSLVKLLEVVSEDTNIGAVGSKVYFAKGFEFHKDRYKTSELGTVLWFAGGHMDWNNVLSVHEGVDEVDHGQYDQTKPVDFLTGSSMLLSTKALKKVGLLDEKYFLYFEETDLCMRLHKQGLKLIYVPASKVWHANAQATGAGSSLVDYYTTRNRLEFGLRWAPIKTKFHLIKQSLELFVYGRPWQRTGVVDFYLRNLNKGSYVN